MITNKIKNFNFLAEDVKVKIKNLYIEYCQGLTDFTGIAQYKNLECLKVCASTSESRKRVPLEKMKGLEKLDKLKFFELGYYKFDTNELKNEIMGLKNLKEYIIDYKKYDNQ
jgi:hypothetical protein